MSIKKLSNELFDLAKKRNIDELEVYSQTSNSLGIRFFKGQIDNYSIENSSGISCRGIYDGEMGSCYTENMNDNALSLIDGLIENAKIINADEEKFLYEGSNDYREISGYNPKLEDIENDKKIEFLQELERIALEADERINFVNMCYYGEEFGESQIINSKGLELDNKSNLAIAYLSVMAKDGEEIQTGFEYLVTRDFDDLSAEKLAKEAVQKAISMLGAKPVKSGEYKIILKNSAAADLLEAYKSIFSAEMVQKGLSLLKGRLDTKIANDNITILDNPFLESGFSSKGFDAEGVATKDKKVIESGVLKTYLYDLKTAKVDGVEPTGNAARVSYKSTINIAPTNMYIEAGSTDYDDMVSFMDEGIIITDLQGLHSGVNNVSGDFSLSAGGYLVENGEIVRPVNQITIAGNFIDMLCEIDVVGSDFRFNIPSGAGTIGSPSLMVNKLAISGE